MPKINANDIEIAYESFGAEADEAILLIAGLGSQMTAWDVEFCRRLSGFGFRVIRFDNRDVGLSTHFTAARVPELAEVVAALRRGQRPDTPYTLQTMADDAAALLDALVIGKAHIVGRSMGGMIAQLVASQYPERTITLVSIYSSSGNPALPGADPEAMAALRSPSPDPAVDEAGFLSRAVKMERILAGTRYRFDEAGARERALADARRAFDPAGPGRQLAAMVADGDRRERLARIKAPTLVIHGDTDRLMPIASGRDSAVNIPGAKFEVVEGLGHEIPPGFHEELARRIAEFARSVGTA